MSDRIPALFDDLQKKHKADAKICYGKHYATDSARREHFNGLLTKEIAAGSQEKKYGAPVGELDDILAMSDPPHYTAWPNPFMREFISCYGRPCDASEHYHREPYAIDVSEGKTHPIYTAHPYHTKVPHLAIVPSILHYTRPGDIVLDGFCGTGMTGIAAQWCDGISEQYRMEINQRFERQGLSKPEWGRRYAILNDLSPYASFIASNYNADFNVEEFKEAGQRILQELAVEIGWMYETRHKKSKVKGRIEYVVWSQMYSCPECSSQIEFQKEVHDEENDIVKEEFSCPKCRVHLTKNRLEKLYTNQYDSALQRTVRVPKRLPVLIKYVVDGKVYEKSPDADDYEVLKRIDQLPFPAEVPCQEIPRMHMTHERAKMAQYGITHVHHFFSRRVAHALAILWRKANAYPEIRIRHMLLFFVQQSMWTASLMNRYRPSGYSQVVQYMSGVYYIPSQHSECSPWYMLDRKLNRLAKAFSGKGMSGDTVIVSTGSASRLDLPDSCIDYIFTDPPFGENIYYSDLNYLTESWHRVFSNASDEAIIDKFKKKGLPDYQKLMQDCFIEYYRILKPGRWMTVVFHNSRNAVWNAIQEAMLAAGFVVADVRTMDKKQGSYRQVTSTAVKQDLVISVYRPNNGLEERFKLEAGTEEGVWDFIKTHLRQLPIFVSKEGKAEIIAERQGYLLFDRMVAFHVQRGVTVPLSSAEFHSGMAQRFSEREGMYFLSEQVADFDKKRLTVQEILQLSIFVMDESSAIQWLRQQLTRKPQTFQELHPQFLKEIGGWQKYEKPLELADILRQNFLAYDGKGEVPAQVHSYLSTNYKELRRLSKDDAALRRMAKDRWYVPDTSKASDLEKLRDRALLDEFWEYLPPGYVPTKTDDTQGVLPGLIVRTPVPRGNRIKVFRMEAVRTGFKHCWQQRDYRTIIAVAQRIPESILQEDAKLLMWYDQAVTRSGEE